MARFSSAAAALGLLLAASSSPASAFTSPARGGVGARERFTKSDNLHQAGAARRRAFGIAMSTTESERAPVDYNAVYVAKQGGAGVKSASEMMGVRGASTRSLGAPPPRPPRGGTFVTEGGVTIDAAVRPLRFTHGDVDECPVEEGCDTYVSSFFENGGEESGLTWGSDGAIERLVDLLDHRRGALLTSSYEFPGR